MKNTEYEEARNFVQDTLSQDCKFIFEAIDKLIQGVCCFEEEGEICTWDLLPRVHEALQEHIDFEERWLFPRLTAQECKQHQLEHERLLILLARASWELECGYGDQFKSIINDLQKLLLGHHQLKQNDLAFGEKCVTDGNLKKIKDRLQHPWRADIAS